MGLFDVFGAGGGTAAIQIGSTMVGAGSSLEGNVVFTGGKRAQQITRVTMRVSQSTTSMQMTKEGPRQHTQSRDVVQSFQIAGPATSTPGQAQAFPFSINIPQGAPPSQPGHLSYAIHANVDIPGEVDAGATVQLTVVGGGMGAQMPMQPPMGQMPMGMAQPPMMAPPVPGYGAPPQMGMPQMPPPMGAPQMGMPQMPPQPGYPQMPPQMGMPQMPPQMGMPQMPPQPGYPQMPPQPGYPQMPPQPGYPPMPPQPQMGMPPMQPQMGSFVVALHPQTGQWAPGRITAMQNGMFGVDWDDPMLGASTWVAAGQLRVK